MFKIERNIPFIDVQSSRRASYPFDAMKPGDSFEAPIEMRTKLNSATSAYKKKTGKIFAVRVYGEGIRVWRLA